MLKPFTNVLKASAMPSHTLLQVKPDTSDVVAEDCELVTGCTYAVSKFQKSFRALSCANVAPVVPEIKANAKNSFFMTELILSLT